MEGGVLGVDGAAIGDSGKEGGLWESVGLGIWILGGILILLLLLDRTSLDNMGGDLEAEKELYLRSRLSPESGAGPARVSSHNFWRKLILLLL